MHYLVSMPEPQGHLFHVALTLDRPGATPVLTMPVWTPGSYLVREFARHVEGVVATDERGAQRRCERLDKHRFRVEAAGAERIVVTYRVFAHELSVRTNHLDATHGFFNGAALLFSVEGRDREPHVLEISPPSGWRVACSLPPAPGASDPLDEPEANPSVRTERGEADPSVRTERSEAKSKSGSATTDALPPWRFLARDYDELVDSPVEIGPHRVITFDALGKRHGVVLWGNTASDVSALPGDMRRIVEHVGTMMGGLPYDRYLFIVHLTGSTRGGLEHGASTTLQVKRSAFHPRDAYQETLALVAHEFFHVWNVKGLRPAALVPYDYTREQYTRLLWWFEGVTSYYDELTVVRTGLGDAKRYLKHLGEQLTTLVRLPGAKKVSVEESSFTAWVKLYRPDENTSNSTVSYYLKGELIAFALDLLLRKHGGSLDELVRSLVARFGSGGLPEEALGPAVAERVGREAARAFFDRNVRGTGEPEIDLASVGLTLRRRPSHGFDDKGGTPPKGDAGPTAGWLGVTLESGPRLAVRWVSEGGPAWRAGLTAGDEIVAESGLRVDRAGLWNRMTELGPGGRLHLTVFRQDQLQDVEVVLGTPPEDAVWIEAVAEPTPEQRAAYRSWLGMEGP